MEAFTIAILIYNPLSLPGQHGNSPIKCNKKLKIKILNENLRFSFISASLLIDKVLFILTSTCRSNVKVQMTNVKWNIGIMEHWNHGTLRSWNIGMVE